MAADLLRPCWGTRGGGGRVPGLLIPYQPLWLEMRGTGARSEHQASMRSFGVGMSCHLLSRLEAGPDRRGGQRRTRLPKAGHGRGTRITDFAADRSERA